MHLTTECLKALTQTDMVHVPYKGAAAALTDLMGGQIQLSWTRRQGLINPGKAGKVRLIGVASDKRLPALPDVPTFIEQGVRASSAAPGPACWRRRARRRRSGQARGRRGRGDRAGSTT